MHKQSALLHNYAKPLYVRKTCVADTQPWQEYGRAQGWLHRSGNGARKRDTKKSLRRQNVRGDSNMSFDVCTYQKKR